MIYRKRKSGAKNSYFYHAPFNGSCFADDKGEGEGDLVKLLHTHLFCTAGLLTVMGIGHDVQKSYNPAIGAIPKFKKRILSYRNIKHKKT